MTDDEIRERIKTLITTLRTDLSFCAPEMVPLVLQRHGENIETLCLEIRDGEVS